MKWLEENFSDFFKASMISKEADETDHVTPVEAEDFSATNFSEDGKTIDFNVKAFDFEMMILNIDV